MKSFLTAAALVLLSSQSVFAETPSITISPPFQEVVVGQEQRHSFSITVQNLGSSSIQVNLTTLDIGQENELKNVGLINISPTDYAKQYGLVSWLILPTSVVSIDPGSTKKIDFFVDNRDSLSPGGHYGSILGTISYPKGITSKDQLKLTASFLSEVLVKKTGGERYDLSVSQISDDAGVWSESSKEKLRFQNLGNTHAVPRGTVTITDPWGSVVSQGVINEDSAYILPSSFRDLSVALHQQSQYLWPGVYTTKVQFRYVGENDSHTVQKSFLYLGSALATLVGLVFILGLIFIFKRRVSQLILYLRKVFARSKTS